MSIQIVAMRRRRLVNSTSLRDPKETGTEIAPMSVSLSRRIFCFDFSRAYLDLIGSIREDTITGKSSRGRSVGAPPKDNLYDEPYFSTYIQPPMSLPHLIAIGQGYEHRSSPGHRAMPQIGSGADSSGKLRPETASMSDSAR